MSISREEVIELLNKVTVDSDKIDSFSEEIEDIIESYDESNQALDRLFNVLNRLILQLEMSNASSNDVQSQLRKICDILKKG